jgi:hypothetical protein
MLTDLLKSIVVHPAEPDGVRSIPAEVGTAAPFDPVVQSGPVEHPQELTTTVAAGAPPIVPMNDSKLALGRPHAPGDRPGRKPEQVIEHDAARSVASS